MTRSMSWKYKALLQQAFSRVPGGEQLNYLCQRWATKSLPTGEAKVCELASHAKEHIDIVRAHWGRPIGEVVFYEFGAGWDMLNPMTFWASGVERQIVIDIRRLLRAELVNDVIKKLQCVPLNFSLLRKPDKPIERGVSAVSSLKEHYGIDYRAPCDARATGLEASCVDCITSTSTLEHIPPRDIQAILAECHRILKRDGLMSFRIDYEDHYAYFDHQIPVYNFLRYSDRAWAAFNASLHYQNRLRHRDYLALIQAAGFAVIDNGPREGTPPDLETLRGIPVSKRFAGYSLEELAVHGSHLVLRKQTERVAE